MSHGHGAPGGASKRIPEPNPNPERIFTLEELKKYDGSNPTSPVFLGCRGVVYDVTAGESFYGPGGPYGAFAGRDASKGLATMEVAYKGADIRDLTPAQKHSLDEWAEKYNTKYPIVGKIVDYSEPNSGPAPEGGWPAPAASSL